MPKHRTKDKLPKNLIKKIKASEYSEYFGNIRVVKGNRLLRMPTLPDGKKAHIGSLTEVHYTLKDNVLTRTEFLAGTIAIPLHIAHFDPNTGIKFSTALDCF